jgi:hypothetical protein
VEPHTAHLILKVRLGCYGPEEMAPKEEGTVAESFFEISHPRHLFNKAQRDFDKMKANVNTDTVFNFFVTAYHIKDYVKTERNDLTDVIEKVLREDEDLGWCDYLCQKGKHLKVDAERLKGRPTLGTKCVGSSVLGKAILGEAVLGSMGRTILLADGKPIDVVAIGQRVLEKWRRFLEENDLWIP